MNEKSTPNRNYLTFLLCLHIFKRTFRCLTFVLFISNLFASSDISDMIQAIELYSLEHEEDVSVSSPFDENPLSNKENNSLKSAHTPTLHQPRQETQQVPMNQNNLLTDTKIV